MKQSDKNTAPPIVPTKPIRSIVLVGGDKGGVGKSATARALAEFFEREEVSYIGYDGDDVNPSFLRFFPAAGRLQTKMTKGLEPLINGLEGEGPPVQLVDLGAGTSLVLTQFCKQTGFIDVAAQYAVSVVFVFVLAPSADSIGLLKILSEEYGAQLRYVIARSEAIPGTWSLWEESKTRARLLNEFKAVEISIPSLDAEAFSLVDRHSLRWSAATSDKRLPLVSRSYVHRWLQRIFGEFEKAEILPPTQP